MHIANSMQDRNICWHNTYDLDAHKKFSVLLNLNIL